MMYFPCFAISLNLNHLYISIGQHKGTVDFMQEYLIALVPAVMVYAQCDLQRKWLIC